MLSEPTRVLVVEARTYDAVSDALVAGAGAALTAGRAEHQVMSAPGLLAIPAIVAMAEEGGHRPAGVRFDGYVALGCVIRGETYRFEIVASECARGLTDLAIGRRLAIGNGVLSVENEAQALTRAKSGGGDMGGEAARACLAIIDLRRRLLGQAR